jgi:ADP-ribosyl-[dinitrogen reductase] hydrolase
MRAHPLGCLRDRDEVLRIAAIQSRVTHGHPRRRSCGASSAVLVFDGIAGVPPSAEIPAGIYEATFATAWRDADRHSTTTGDLPAHLRDVDMSGWATVAAAHAISLHYNDNPEVAIGAAAASGCDTDTIASIVGAIVGARYGRGALPTRWTTGMARGVEELCDAASVSLYAIGESSTRSQLLERA